jgi:hypothetical protein
MPRRLAESAVVQASHNPMMDPDAAEPSESADSLLVDADVLEAEKSSAIGLRRRMLVGLRLAGWARVVVFVVGAATLGYGLVSAWRAG